MLDAEERKTHRREYIRRYNAGWRARHPERERDRVGNRRRQKGYELKHKYGITLEAWDALFAAQGNTCGACFSPAHGGKDWHTDHDHATGEIRGILCCGCNIAIGHAGDDPARLRQMAGYLEKQAGA